MKKQQLLIDSMPMRLSLEESDNGSSRLVARGEYARYDKPTDNKRFYPKSLWEKNLKRLSDSLGRKRVFGELDHPGDGKTKLQRVSHVLTGLKLEDDGTVHGVSELLNTPHGRILKELLTAGCEVGVSSRGFGSTSVNKEGYEVVGDDYKLLTFDFVADPADKTAYPEIFAEESKIPEDDMELTLEKLKADYPDLVRMIGEEMKFKDDEKARKKEDQQKAIEEAVKAAEERIENSMKEKFAKELVSKLEEVKGQAEEKVRTELLADPDVAGSKPILEAIVAAVKPLMMPIDFKSEVDARDKEMEDLRVSMAEKDLELANSQSELEELAGIAKTATFSLYIEKRFQDAPREYVELVRDLVGDLADFESKDELDSRLEAIESELERQAEEVAAELEARDDEITARDEEIERLKHENMELVSTVDQVKELAEQLKLQTYIEGKLSKFEDPAKIRSALVGVNTTEDVDTILEGLIAGQGASHDSDEAAAIRARIGKGRENDLIEEVSGVGVTDHKMYDGAIESVHGIPIEEIAKACGINS
jgi:hypothetical protein